MASSEEDNGVEEKEGSQKLRRPRGSLTTAWLICYNITMTAGCASWTVRKANRKKINSFERWCWRRVLRILWRAKKTSKWVLEQFKPEYSLEAKMMKLRISCFGHIRESMTH